jgi:hypothetical protein
MAAKMQYVRATTLNHLPLEETKRSFDAVLAKEAGLQALKAKADAEGFLAVRGKESNWGMNASWTTNDGRSVSYEMHTQSVRRDKDQACLVTETLRTSERETATFHSFLVAPKGNFKNVSEFYTDKAYRVRLAHSKWTRFTACVRRKCVGTCLGSLVTCSGTWAAYLGCVFIACGGCMAVCGACALCNCSWWCKWAVGCCKD